MSQLLKDSHARFIPQSNRKNKPEAEPCTSLLLNR